MPLNILCSKCGSELQKPGGLLFSPPDEMGRSIKMHLCTECYDHILEKVLVFW